MVDKEIDLLKAEIVELKKHDIRLQENIQTCADQANKELKAY
jgi:hypothetical protein